MRVYTVLEAGIQRGKNGGWEQVRLWIVAPSKRSAVRMLQQREVWWREMTFSGPMRPGPFLDSINRSGLLSQPAVYAYSMPWLPSTPVLRVESVNSFTQCATMGDVFPDA